MSELFAAVCSIAPTKRRRFLWAAWWTGAPTKQPFRRPDAFSGGARSREEALALAENAAGQRLVEIDPRWARAAHRQAMGHPPWTARDAADTPHAGMPRASAARNRKGLPESVWDKLGIPASADATEIKRAYRKRALETHPDRGGTASAFQDVHRAYEEALRRRTRSERRPKPKKA